MIINHEESLIIAFVTFCLIFLLYSDSSCFVVDSNTRINFTLHVETLKKDLDQTTNIG